MSNSNVYEFPDAKGIVVSGDIHGDYEALVYKCCLLCQMIDTLIIVAGDWCRVVRQDGGGSFF